MTIMRTFVVCTAVIAGIGLAVPYGEAQRPLAPSPAPAPSASPTTRPSQPPSASPTSPDATAPGPTRVMGSSLVLPSDYKIGPGDLLQINVWKNETLSRIVPVRPDGKISLPLLQDVQAAGLTPMQLRDKLANSFAEFMPNPEVSVSVNDVRSMRISVLGQVQKPGVLELHGATTILEAIAMAGGFRDFASPSRIVVLRTDQTGKTDRIKFNYNRAVSNSGDEQNMILKPGDVVVVP
jgi:polysaccharide export outer membrane protein